jgi:hypothetical protein
MASVGSWQVRCLLAGSALTALANPSLALAGNTSLAGKLVTETFTGTAVSSTAKTVPPGTIVGTAGAATISVRYDAAQNAYTITNAPRSRSQTFAPADAVTSTDPKLVTFRKTGIGQIDTLTLTKATAFGKGGYEWVQGGWWQRSKGAALTTSDVFAFGIPTLNAAVPRSGSGSYALSIYGIGAWERAQTFGTGSGTMTADFVKGSLTGTGEIFQFNTATKSLSSRDIWSFTARLSTSANTVTGTFGFDGVAGGLKGRFYGPAGQEFGATVFARGQNYAGAGAFTAVLLGSQTGYSNPASGLIDLKGDQTFGPYSATFWGVTFKPDGTYKDRFTNSSPISVLYAAKDGSFAVRSDFNNEIVGSSADPASAKLTNAQFLGYARNSAPFGGTLRTELQLYRRGADNPEVQFTYMSFAHASYVFTAADKARNTGDRWVAFGIPTFADRMPVKGRGAYSGVIYGTALRDGTGQSYRIEGKSSFVADFLAQTVTAKMLPTLVDAKGTRTALGTLTGGGGIQSYAYPGQDSKFASGFSATLQGDGFGSAGIDALFYGPRATEIAGTFGFDFVMPGASWGGKAQGVVGAKR